MSNDELKQVIELARILKNTVCRKRKVRFMHLSPRPSNGFLDICNVSATALKERSLGSEALLVNHNVKTVTY